MSKDLIRAVPFELERSTSDGLTLEGYAAVFNETARIDSWEGQFDEVIVPGAFLASLARSMPRLMFEHGQHPLIGAMPLGRITDAVEDSRGLYIKARLSDNWLIQPVRDAVRDGAVSGMSFRFSSAPSDLDDVWLKRTGNVPLRTLRRLTVRELGPVVFPAYEPTTASVRSLVDRLAAPEGADDQEPTVDPDARSAGDGDPDTEPGNGAASTPYPLERVIAWSNRRPLTKD